MFDINKMDNDNDIRLTDHIIGNNKFNYINQFGEEENFWSHGIKNIYNNFIDEKIMKRTKSSNEFNFGNKIKLD